MALDGFIFDLDGVLIDSNGAHIKAWLRAFRRFGYNVEPDRLAIEMGKGGDKLVTAVLGGKAEETRGQALRAAEKEEFTRVALEEGFRVAPGAQELLAELRRRQIKTALATSSGDDQVDLAERASRVKWRYLVDEVVTASDVTETKPAPDLVNAAVRKLKMAPTQCVMLGDAPWDALAATRAGVVLLAVTRGGNSPEVLLQNGARAVYQDPADILSHLDEALRLASPGSAHFDTGCLDRLMGGALAAAEKGLSAGGLPFGCVVVDGSGEIVESAYRASSRTLDVTAHAELEALRRASAKGFFPAPDCVVVCTAEPCVMCTGAAMELGVDTIVFALRAPAERGTARVLPSATAHHHRPRIVGGIREKESRQLLERWMEHAPADSSGQAKVDVQAEVEAKEMQRANVRQYLAHQT